MIDVCLNALLTELNSYIKSKIGIVEQKVVLANLVGQDGFPAIEEDNKIVMSLVDIAKEDLGTNAKEYIPQGQGFIAKNPAITFNIYVLFSVHFKTQQMLEGLKYLAMVIAFFQSKAHFTVQNTPLLQQGSLDNISVELMGLNAQEKSNLWGYLGAKYVPSILYKIGMISIEDSLFVTEVPEIKDVEIKGIAV